MKPPTVELSRLACKAIRSVWREDEPWTNECGLDTTGAIFGVVCGTWSGPATLLYDPDDSNKFKKPSRATTAFSHCDGDDATSLRHAVTLALRVGGLDPSTWTEMVQLLFVFNEWSNVSAPERLALLADLDPGEVTVSEPD